MSLYLSIAKYNLRFNFLWHIAAAFCLILFTPVLFGITALDAMTAAYPLELALPFMGVIFMTPIYSFEQDRGILDTVAARKTPYLLICGIRIIIAVVFMFVFISGFVLLLLFFESEVSLAHAGASFATAVFLGSLGILAAAISRNAIIGYMVPILYFILDLMGSLGSFTMFSMMRNGTMKGKEVLFFIGISLIGASIWIRNIILKRRYADIKLLD